MSWLLCKGCQWRMQISDTSSLHWTISERLPSCPNKRWYNFWKHKSYTVMGNDVVLT